MLNVFVNEGKEIRSSLVDETALFHQLYKSNFYLSIFLNEESERTRNVVKKR